MSYALKTYRLLNSLSIDVAAGAVICALFLAEILRSRPGTPALIMLGLTVWIIYSADHLLDARRIEREAVTHRHSFYQRHFQVMVTIDRKSTRLNSSHVKISYAVFCLEKKI